MQPKLKKTTCVLNQFERFFEFCCRPPFWCPSNVGSRFPSHRLIFIAWNLLIICARVIIERALTLWTTINPRIYWSFASTTHSFVVAVFCFFFVVVAFFCFIFGTLFAHLPCQFCAFIHFSSLLFCCSFFSTAVRVFFYWSFRNDIASRIGRPRTTHFGHIETTKKKRNE